MLRRLRLRNFKSFTDSTLALGPLTTLIGANASGKSNIRDAFRFLHGLSRGYSLAETIGEKWIEGGVLQWRGVRGGSRQIVQQGADYFSLAAEFDIQDGSRTRRVIYQIHVEILEGDYVPRVKLERLRIHGRESYVFDTHPDGSALGTPDSFHVLARVRKLGPGAPRQVQFLSSHPILTQLEPNPTTPEWARRIASATAQALNSMRFLDLNPDAARQPSQAGVTTLGDRGENLSSVLQAISRDSSMRQELAEWIKELTPLDVTDFEFETDSSGRVLAVLVEDDGSRTPLTSASDGTIRFLATIAALLGPERARFSFFEEIENGIHPNRLHLLLDLINRSVGESGGQVVATTHSPYLLLELDDNQRKFASLTYRVDGGTAVLRILELPEAKRILAEHDLARLMAAGWFEDTVTFTLAPEPGPEAAA
jgi:predicted ATPase